MSLDANTVIVVGLLLLVAEVVGLTLVLLVIRHSVPLRWWVASAWLVGLSPFVGMAVSDWPPEAAAVLDAALDAASYTMIVQGMAVFLKAPQDRRLMLLLAAASIACAGWVAATGAGPGDSTAVHNLWALVWNGWTVWLLYRHAGRSIRFSARFAMGVFSMAALANVVGVLYGDIVGERASYAQGHPLALAFLGQAILQSLAAILAVILLVAERMVADLKVLARTDLLTRLPNRGALLERGARLLAQCRGNGEAFAALIFDLDHFKRINDELGHDAGDAVLQHVALLMMEVMRTPGIVGGRYGGEEFVLFLAGRHAQAAHAQAEALRARLGGSVVPFASHALHVTASIGVAVDNGHFDLAVLLSRADAALYRAKAHGRDQVWVA